MKKNSNGLNFEKVIGIWKKGHSEKNLLNVHIRIQKDKKKSGSKVFIWPGMPHICAYIFLTPNDVNRNIFLITKDSYL